MKTTLVSSCLLGVFLLVGCQSPLDDSLYQKWSRDQGHDDAKTLRESLK